MSLYFQFAKLPITFFIETITSFMQPPSSDVDFAAAILRLQAEQIEQKKRVKEQFHHIIDDLSPLHLLKNTLVSVTENNHILHAAVGLSTGFLSRRLFNGIENKSIQKLLGAALLFGVTTWLTKHPAILVNLERGVSGLFDTLRKKS